MQLYAGHDSRAATFLAEAYASNEQPSDLLRLMLGRAIGTVDALVVSDPAPVDGMVFAAGGRRFVTYDRHGHVRVYRVDAAPVVTLADTPEELSAIAVSRDGAKIAIAPTQGPISIWSGDDGHRLVSLDNDHQGSLAFSPDGARLYVGRDGIEAFDAATGKHTVESAVFEWGVSQIAVTGDGRNVIAVVDRHLAVIDAATLAVTASRGEEVERLSPSGDRVIVRAADSRQPPAPKGDAPLVVRDELYNPMHLDAPLASFEGPDAATYELGGDRVLRIGLDAILLHDRDGREIGKYAGGTAALAPSGRRVAVCDDGGTIWIWDDHEHVIAHFTGHEHAVKFLAFSPDSRELVSGGEDGLRLWHVPDADVHSLGFRGRLLDDAVSADGKRLVATDGNDAIVYDTTTATAVARLASSEPLWWASMSPDGTRVATASSAGHIALWDVAGKRQLAETSHIAFTVRFSPDGARIVTSGDRDTYVWDATTLKQLAKCAGTDELTISARFSPDGTRVVAAARDHVARVYDVATMRRELEAANHTDYVIDAAYDPTGQKIVTASGDGTAVLWDAHSGTQLAVLVGHTTALHGAMFSRDGSRVLTVGSEGARVWSSADGKLEAVLAGSEPLVGARFLGDGSIVATSTAHGARLWDARHGEPIFSLPPPAPEAGAGIVAGNVLQPLHDPRQRADTIAEAPDGSWIVFDHVQYALPREHRAADTLAALVDARSGWRMLGGGLVPAAESARRTDESARVEASVLAFEFADETIEAVLRKPQVVLPPAADTVGDANAASVEHKLQTAFDALTSRAGLATARAMTAGLPELPAVSPRALYQLAWVRADLGEDVAAFHAMRAAAMHWGAIDPSLRHELMRMAAAADASPEEVTPSLADPPANRVDPVTLDDLAEAYRDAGDAEARGARTGTARQGCAARAGCTGTHRSDAGRARRGWHARARQRRRSPRCCGSARTRRSMTRPARRCCRPFAMPPTPRARSTRRRTTNATVARRCASSVACKISATMTALARRSRIYARRSRKVRGRSSTSTTSPSCVLRSARDIAASSAATSTCSRTSPTRQGR